jgi:hypothetical protein
VAKKRYSHLFIDNLAEAIGYKPKSERFNPSIPIRQDRVSHAQRLIKQFDALWKNEQDTRKAHAVKARNGAYVEFTSSVGHDLLTKSLENIQQGIRLLNVREIDNEIKATVYIPAGKERYFINKIEDYQNIDTRTGKPKNANLVNSIEDIGIALLEALWIDPPDLIPISTNKAWVECWLRISDDEEIQKQEIADFIAILQASQIEAKSNYLVFPERAVVLINASREQLAYLIMICDILAEFRIGQETCGFWINESNKGQIEWVNELLSRLQLNSSNVKACLLDSGVNNGHRLLQPVLATEDCLTVNPAWGTDDHEIGSGHGTLMAGIVAYGDLEQALLTTGMLSISHKLCSVKIIPRLNQNPTPKELWGDITKQAISRSEIQNPDKLILYCLAVTSSTDVDRGRPSSWSGAIDELAYAEGKNQRMLIITAGNVEGNEKWERYPNSNLLSSVQNPAQSWNALTIGAYTEKHTISDPMFNNSQIVAPPGGLSPFSTTSQVWASKWPIKPEVVFEGGNLFIDSYGHRYAHDDLSILSTSKNIQVNQFGSINATSAAAAQATWFASQIALKYPSAWPETIRGLIVHSAKWNDTMIQQVGNGLRNKRDYQNLIRVFGYGKPDLITALYSSESAFTMILQEYIQPFEKSGSTPKMKDMHFYKLPWPKDVLLALGELNVRLRITLSYFIQPGVGEIGWKDKYRYQSYGLRFDLNNENEDEDTFKKRINIAVREEDEEVENNSGSDRWRIGVNNRKVGSLHSDIWEGTAAQMSLCNMIAVYPIIGWWRERRNLKKENTKTRYSLIVSLETPPVETDIYSVVETMIHVPVEVPIEIDRSAT